MLGTRNREKEKKSTLYKRMFLTHLVLLLIPLFCMGISNVLLVKKNTNKALAQLFASEGKNSLDSLEEQLGMLVRMAGATRQNTAFYEPFSAEKYPQSIIDIKDYLYEKSMWMPFVEDVFYYNKAARRAVSSTGLVSEETLFGYHLLQAPKVNTLPLGNDEYQVFNTFSAIVNRERLTVALPLEPGETWLLFALDQGKLKNLLMVPGYGKAGRVELFWQGQRLYTDLSAQEETDSRYGRGARTFDRDSSGFKLKWLIPAAVYWDDLLPGLGSQLLIALIVFAVGQMLIAKAMALNYNPIKELAASLTKELDPEKGGKLEIQDEVKYLDQVMGELLYSKQFLEESNREIKAEQLLYQLLYSPIQRGSILYQECLDCGIRVDRQSFICLYLEENMEKEPDSYEFITESLSDGVAVLDVYSTYYAERGFIFLIAADLPQDELENCLQSKIRVKDDEALFFGTAVNAVDQIHDSYQSILHAQEQSGKDNNSSLGTSLTALAGAVESEQLAKAGLIVRDLQEIFKEVCWSSAVLGYLEAAKLLTDEHPSYHELLKLADLPDGRERLGEQLNLLYKRFRSDSVLTAVEPADDFAGKEKDKAWQRDMEETLEYIRQHYMEMNFSIKNMASELGTTPSNLSHYFKKATGQNISKYIDSLKISKAVELLETPLKVAEIAEQLGYSTTAVFIENFKRVRGMTPNQYRKSRLDI